MMAAVIAPAPPSVVTITHRPAAPLASFVDLFWYRRGPQPDSRRNRALPTGKVDLVFDLDDHGLRVFADDLLRAATSARGAIVHGPQSRYFVLDAHRDVHVLGVHFHPGAGALLLGVPARALADRHVALEDLWSGAARDLRERLLEAATPAAMFALLERELLDRMHKVPRVNPAISFALRGIRTAPAEVRVGALQEATGYSSRRFLALFADSVGLTPKVYGRIQRLKGLVEAAAALPRPDWAELACAHGYYDQSHLAREFRELSGVTPAQYRPLPRRPLHMNLDPEAGADPDMRQAF
jgi:AraC-like DNA-binding protein